MDIQKKVAYGKLLGEIYRIQKALGIPNECSDHHVYGLQHGMEPSIRAIWEEYDFISVDEIVIVDELFDEIESGNHKDVTSEEVLLDILESRGLPESKGRKVLQYYKLGGFYKERFDALKDNPLVPPDDSK
ncbi:hypothetical protein [Thermoactinomyces sp. DSM 45892]|uniref:hypothetical protein n=1 Tax=Thermoactinomyces sp. DSM 45892 TaxID=1882753 RepID=UPI0008955576|nr:hypothetical protein [Thermoactinomyces sp. DSM 45892]SDY84008.1 hypothetical protein SAMN05444416_10942 [Thermoactinomyces sp. DSM 45892]